MQNNICILLVFLFATLGACRKERTAMDNSFARDNSEAENLFSDLYKVVNDVSAQTDGIREDGIGCIDTVIVDTTSIPRSITIDFGTDNCTGNDGRIRKGILFITYTGRYRDEGTVITITPQNYTVNGYGISGTKVITNMGLNTIGQPHYNIEVEGTVNAPNNAWTATWNSSRTRTWIAGYEENSSTIWDDVYEITGNANGINRFGNPYTVNINTALRVEIGCPWIVSGVLTISPQENDARVVNFGSGNCNNGFTVTVNGETEEFNGGD